MVNILTVENFQETIEKNDLSLIQIKSSWCQPCKMITPIIDEISNDIQNVYFGQVDAETNPKVAENLNVRSIPTVILFKKGEEVERFVGLKQKKYIIDLIDQYI